MGEPLQMPPQPKYSENCAHVLPSASGKDRHVLCAMANRMDDSIGDLEIYLKEKGMWNNTLIWVTTDNGGMLPPGMGGGKAGSASSIFPLRSGKTSLFQGGVRGVCFVTGGVVPMMARGNVVNGLIQHLDIPTKFPGTPAMLFWTSEPSGPADRPEPFTRDFSNDGKVMMVGPDGGQHFRCVRETVLTPTPP